MQKTEKFTTTAILVGVMVFLICIVIVVIVFYIKCAKRKHSQHAELKQLDDCVFDIFITYAQPDHQIMEQFYQTLTNEPVSKKSTTFKVAFNDKDFIPGKISFKNWLYLQSSRL